MEDDARQIIRNVAKLDFVIAAAAGRMGWGGEGVVESGGWGGRPDVGRKGRGEDGETRWRDAGKEERREERRGEVWATVAVIVAVVCRLSAMDAIRLM